MKSYTEIGKMVKKNVADSKKRLSKQYKNTRSCQAFYAGDIMNYKDTIQFALPTGRKKKATVQFNKVKPYVNAVKGFMAQNRRPADYSAKIEAKLLRRQYTEYANALKNYIRANNYSDQIETQQDGDMLSYGYGAIETAMTYGDGHATTDPNGEIVAARLDPLKVGWDPNAKAPNLIDKKYCWYEQEYDLDEALSLFKDSKEEDFEQEPDETDTDEYEFFPRGGAYDKIKEGWDWADKDENRVRVIFYQWYDIEPFYRAENPIYNLNETARMIAEIELQKIAADYKDNGLFEFDPADKILIFDDKVKSKMEELFEDYIEIIESPRKVFYTTVVSGEHTFTAYPSISQQDMSIQFKTGDYDAHNGIWTGMINSMMEPMLYYNKALTELLFVISANSKGGVMVEKGSVENIREFEKQYAKTDAVCIVEEGAISGNKIKDKRSTHQPTGYEQIISMADQSIPDVTGIDRSFLGSTENRDESGVLYARRIRQVMSSLACYFDSISLFQIINSRLLMDFMRVYAENNEGALFSIIGEDSAEEFIRLTKDKLMAEFSVSIVESPTTPDQKKEQAQFLFDLGQSLMTMGDPTGKVVIAIGLKYSNIDTADIQKLSDILIPKDGQIDPAYVQQLEQELNLFKSEAAQTEIEKTLEETKKTKAEISKIMAEIEAKKADTVSKLEQAAQIGLENDIIRGNQYSEAKVTI